MKVSFERATEADAPTLVEARNKSFYNDYIKFGECPGYQIPVNEMVDKIKRAEIYKIIKENQIIGDISVQPEEDAIYIGCLEIIPDYQNLGIGMEALKFIEAIYSRATCFWLETPVQNERNCYFYEKAGFRKFTDEVRSEKLTLRTFKKFL